MTRQRQMQAGMLFAVFEDFNDGRDKAGPPAIEEKPAAPPENVSESWTEGYLAGYRAGSAANSEQELTAKLLASVYELSLNVSEASEAAALAVADMLINTIVAITSVNWSSCLPDRIRIVSNQIRPAMTLKSEIIIDDSLGDKHRLKDVSELSQILNSELICSDAVIQWQHGEAIISQATLLKDLGEILAPLSAEWIAEKKR